MSAFQAAYEALRQTVGDVEADKLLTAVENEKHTDVTAEFAAWLVKRAREHRVKGPQYAKQADVIGMLASKVQRGAVRPNNLLSLPPQGGPEDMVELRATLDRVEALAADWERRGEYGDVSLTWGARAVRTALGQSIAEVTPEERAGRAESVAKLRSLLARQTGGAS
ncbi:hypothetical protein [Streptomyces sp. NPDC058869]|uniref:hypothetical protein n=1 Tax=Streptomyces sp. NPDC058869 TaxID=3346659 RepID=UPI0036A8B612